MILHNRIPLLFGAQALTVAPRLILVVPDRRGDRALIAHEEVHAAQQRVTGWLRWWWRYLTNKAFRCGQEVAAYKVQIQHGASLEGCARNLVALYRLGIDLPRARALLSER